MVPQVDLLDCATEPSDEQLAMLMRSMLEDVRVQAERANALLRQRLRTETAEVRRRHLVSPPLYPITSTAK